MNKIKFLDDGSIIMVIHVQEKDGTWHKEDRECYIETAVKHISNCPLYTQRYKPKLKPGEKLLENLRGQMWITKHRI